MLKVESGMDSFKRDADQLKLAISVAYNLVIGCSRIELSCSTSELVDRETHFPLPHTICNYTLD